MFISLYDFPFYKVKIMTLTLIDKKCKFVHKLIQSQDRDFNSHGEDVKLNSYVNSNVG